MFAGVYAPTEEPRRAVRHEAATRAAPLDAQGGVPCRSDRFRIGSRRFACSDAESRPKAPAPAISPRLLGDSLTVEHSALDRAVLVRIQVPQPSGAYKSRHLACCGTPVATDLPPVLPRAPCSAASAWGAGASSMPGRMWLWTPRVMDGFACPRCLIPGLDGAVFSREWKGAFWARFRVGAPERRRRSVEQYRIVERV